MKKSNYNKIEEYSLLILHYIRESRRKHKKFDTIKMLGCSDMIRMLCYESLIDNQNKI